MSKQIYHQDLLSRNAEELALPYELLTGLSASSAKKTTMITAIEKHFDWDIEGCNAKYLASLPHDQKLAVEDYRGLGSHYMNSALRTGRMLFKIDIWRLGEVLDTQDITTTPADVAAFGKSQGAFAKKLFDRSGMGRIMTSVLQDSAAESVQRWKLLADMVKAVSNAPKRSKATVLWRGETMFDAFSPPEGIVQQAMHAHSEKIRAVKPGDTVTRADFSSFSMSPVTAVRFAGRECCIYRLVLPKDVPALFMESYTRPREFEVILPPRTMFKVTNERRIESKVSSGVGMKVLEMELVVGKKAPK